ncbi:MAG: hypothetical protein KA275_04215 [Chitinophagaceae bacterium]|nr:hypothetical protein [Chitinophagaceae bacterium]
MKKIICIMAVAFFVQKTQAQINFNEINNPHTSTLGARYLPTLLGNNNSRGDVMFYDINFAIGNNFMSLGDLQTITNGGQLGTNEINNYVDGLKKSNTVFTSLDLPIVNFTFVAWKKKKIPKLILGGGMREKIDFNFNFNSDIFSLALKGNKQFEGKTISLLPSFNFLAYNEFFVTGAYHFKAIKIKKQQLNIKAATRLRYLQGIASINVNPGAISMYTHPDGRALDFDINLDANIATAVDTSSLNNVFEDIQLDNIRKNAFKNSAKGFATDWGVSAELNNNLQVHLALIDLGKIKFQNNVANYKKTGKVTYEGYEWDKNYDNLNEDSLLNIIKPDVTYDSYSVSLGGKFLLNAVYQFGFKPKAKIPFYKHRTSLTYLQGFNNYLSSSKTPTINIGYNYSILNRINLGVNATLGGNNVSMAGANISFRLAKIKFGIGSNNLMPLINMQSGRGTDVNTFLGIYF